MGNISENVFFNFNFLNVDIFLAIQVTNLKISVPLENIAMEGTVSQIFDIDPG